MRKFSRLTISDLRDEPLAEVSMILDGDAASFVDEVAAALGPLLGLHAHVARHLLVYNLGDSVLLPVPGCFELSSHTRAVFAREIAEAIAPSLRAAQGAAA